MFTIFYCYCRFTVGFLMLSYLSLFSGILDVFAKSLKSACCLFHVYPTVRVYQQGCHRKDFREIWYWGLYWKICRKKISDILGEDLTTMYCCRYINSPQIYCCATLDIFILLTVTCMLTMHRKRVCCVSITKVLTRTCRIITLDVYCLSCSKWRCCERVYYSLLF